MTKNSHYQTGLKGEEIAAKFLQKKTMVLLHQRYHSPYGEIDLIMQDGNTMVFVEVKTRTNGNHEQALGSISKKKKEKIIKSANYFIGMLQEDISARFDVVSISKDGIMHIKNAFEGFQW